MVTSSFGTKAFGIPRANGAAARSLGKPAAVYPDAVAGDSDLMIAVDRQQTRLALPLSALDTSMTVVDATLITADNLLTIDNEIVKTTGAPVSNVVPISRGFDGTAPATHLASAIVSGFVDAYHHNALAAEIEAIEQALGPNLANVPSVAFVVSTVYNFVPQTPGGSLTVGNNVITLAPVPDGVNGTDTNHYLYISGGTGTAEAALITGGTAVAGAASGTIIVNCANTHSGAWTIRSATAGIQEALQASTATVQILIPAGTHNLYGPVTVSGSQVILQGAGKGITRLSVSPGTFDAVTFTAGNFFNGIKDLTISTAPGRVDGYAVTAVSQVIFIAAGVQTEYMPNGFRIISGNQNTLQALTISEHRGTGILVDGPNGFVLRIDGAVMSSGLTPAQGIRIRESGDSIISNSHLLNCIHGLLADPGAGQTVASLELISIYGDNCITTGVRFAPTAGGTITRVRMNSVWASSTSAGEGMTLTTASGGTIDGVQIVNGQFYMNRNMGLLVDGATNVSVTASHFGGNSTGAPGTQPGAMINASNFQFTGNVSGVVDGFTGNTQSYGLQVFSGPNNNYIVANNDFRNNAAAPISDNGTGLNKIVKDNLGVDDVTQGMASAAAITIPGSGAAFYITGAVTVTTINGGWKGRTIRLLKTDAGTAIIGGGGNVPLAHPLAQNAAVTLSFDGSVWL